MDVRLVQGLANAPGGRLRAVRTEGRSGATVWLFNKADVEALAAGACENPGGERLADRDSAA